MRPAYKIVNKLITPISQKRGIVSAKIILDWEKIVGQTYASWSRPLKITFPKNIRRHGTLHLHVNPAHALVIVHGQDLLIDKINIFFGYRAVSKVTMVQVPFEKKINASAAKTVQKHTYDVGLYNNSASQTNAKFTKSHHPQNQSPQKSRLEKALDDLEGMIKNDSNA